MPQASRWKPRLDTATAMAALCLARLTVVLIPFSWWRGTIGGRVVAGDAQPQEAEARRLASHMAWAARRLPFSTKCLPRAMALSWMLRRRRIDHAVVLAVRPADQRGPEDALHAWVEMNGKRIIGDLPGRWSEALRLGGGAQAPVPRMDNGCN